MAPGPRLPPIWAIQLVSARPQVSPHFLRAWHPTFISQDANGECPQPGCLCPRPVLDPICTRGTSAPCRGLYLWLRSPSSQCCMLSLSPDAALLSPFLPDLLLWGPGFVSDTSALAAPSRFLFLRSLPHCLLPSFHFFLSLGLSLMPLCPPTPLRGAGPQAPSASPSANTRAPSRESWPSTRATWSPSWRPVR